MECGCDLRTRLVGDGCPICNPELAAEIEAENEKYRHPPCQDCGAMTPEEAETKCVCSGDRDSCHGTELWPD